MNVLAHTFATWTEVLAWVHAGKRIRYHAPLDIFPRHVFARVRGKRLRIDPLTKDADPFWADSGHLSRVTKWIEA